MQYICKYQSPFGGITISADGNSLTGLWFDGQKYFAATLPAAHEEKQLPVFDQTRKWLDSYFSGETRDLHPRYTPKGRPFGRPYGKYCCKYRMGKQLPTRILRKKSHGSRESKPCRRRP